MKIGIDLRPLQEYSRFRGIGTVTYELSKSLVRNFPEDQYFFYFYKDLPLPNLKDLFDKGRAIGFDKSTRSFIFDNFLDRVTKKNLTISENLDVFLATDPTKDIPAGTFRRITVFYDLIGILLTENYLKESGGSLPINLLKLVKLVRYRFVKKTITEKIRDSLKSDRILAISETTKRDLIKHFNVPKEKVEVMYLAAADYFQKLDETDWGVLQAKYGLENKFVLYVGGLDYRKNVMNLLKAVESIKERGFPQMVIAGKDVSRKSMPEAMEIRNFVKKKGLDSRVKLLDFIEDEDLVRLYNTAEFFVFPSLFEGFGLGVLEAMACETPVICSDIPALKEVAGDAVVYFNPTDPNDIAKKLILLNNNKSLKEGLIKKGRERVKNFTWENASTKAHRSFLRFS